MDFDAIWQVHLWGPLTHCVRWGSLTLQVKGRFGGRYHLANRNGERFHLFPNYFILFSLVLVDFGYTFS